MDLKPEIVAQLESGYAQIIYSRIKKFVWADPLSDDRGQLKFGIYFKPGHKLEYRIDIHTTIKIIVAGTNVYNGNVLINSESFISELISHLEKSVKFLNFSPLNERRVLYEYSTGRPRRHVSDRELTEKLDVIPDEDCELISYSYTTECIYKNLSTGDKVTIKGQNESDELIRFRARQKLYRKLMDEDPNL